jgi:hypothetical protein
MHSMIQEPCLPCAWVATHSGVDVAWVDVLHVGCKQHRKPGGRDSAGCWFIPRATAGSQLPVRSCKELWGSSGARGLALWCSLKGCQPQLSAVAGQASWVVGAHCRG